jgi:cobalt-zinc-cadmium resistance protein CzcA
MKQETALLPFRFFLFIPLFIIWPSSRSNAQSIPINLDDAFEIATRNYPLLKRDAQRLTQQELLLNTAANPSQTHIFVGGSQIDPNSINGVQGVGFIQRFNWPSGKKYRRAVLEERRLLAAQQAENTALELRREVALAYFELLYAKELRTISIERRQLTEELFGIASQKLESGETGKIPVLEAEGRYKRALLTQQQAQEQYDIAYTIFNNWLYSDTAFVAQGPGLPPPQGYLNIFVEETHPKLLLAEQKVNLAQSKIQQERSQRLPQILAGGQLQMVDGDSPFYAYVLGLGIPLGQKPIKARVQSAQVEVDIEQTELKALRADMENQRRTLIARLKKEQSALDFLRKEMLPLADEQITDTRRAYQESVVDYKDYVMNLEQALNTRWSYLQHLRQYHLIRLELEFLTGKR